ncbi:MAG: OFA family MFS transporter [Verrucomicrobia bacterium]|nr:OFA family MFS transporter [Verrucomicrobiota bacterium]MBU1735055.1 OFA family MFS transporter [Verrucomicrobiota bacterium]MBU1857057.1 OFA family MFS transporter [Verrucomicrobiota bacterium]
MGLLLQLCLGTVYAWSYFQKPLMAAYGCSNSQVAWGFSLAICFLGLTAPWVGLNLERFGPRRLALAGGFLYALGYLITGLAIMGHSLLWLYLGFGVVGGIGLGLGYVAPIATVAKWFPDRKGLVTGMVVMGFGLGALIMAKVIAPVLMAKTGQNLSQVFFWICGVILVVALPAAACLQNVPAAQPGQQAGGKPTASARVALKSRAFGLMWLVFFINITVGIMFIGFQSPMLQDLMHAKSPELTTAALSAVGATLIAISSLFNGFGRLFWGAVSDRLGQIRVFRLILISQIFVFAALVVVREPWLFGVLVCYVLLCYGGGFGVMPSFTGVMFGQSVMPTVYGTILTAWSAAGIVGPQLAAFIKDHYADQAGRLTFIVATLLLLVGAALSFWLRPPAPPGRGDRPDCG